MGQLTSEKRPVLIYIHGGSFDSGSGYNEEWASVAQKLNVVVVSFNYRLSVFGFLAIDLDSTSNVNLGIQDQREALKWINASIADFGGDQNKVQNTQISFYHTPFLTSKYFD